MVLIQATPELAAEIGRARRVVFIDASVTEEQVRLGPVEEGFLSPLAHAIGPGEAVALARRLYGFRGEAWLCHIPGEDFTDGEGLSPAAAANAAVAAERLRAWGEDRRGAQCVMA
jgi:Ni,Fe-hydrogenase maturation factor